MFCPVRCAHLAALPSLAALLAGLAMPAPAAASPTDDALAPRPPASTPRELTGTAGLSAPQLRQYRDMLGSADAPTRKRAMAVLSSLGADSLPGIETRLRKRAAERLDAEQAKKAMRDIRHAAGSRRVDDAIDIAPGIEAALAGQRDKATIAVAEVLLMLRSLEGIASRESGLLLAEVVPMDAGLWRPEMRRVRARAGLWLLPAMIELRSHADRQVKAWAQYGVRKLGMEQPETALAVDDAHLAALVARAYARPLDFEAMPQLVRLVGAPKLELREAARWSVGRFGKNAVWQLREYYEELTGTRDARRWGHTKIARELYTVLDREALEQADTALAKGMNHFVAGELEPMRVAFDAVLGRFPRHPARAKMAAGYAALGAARLGADALDAAAAAYRRALRLAAEGDAKRAAYVAQLAFIEAELSLSRGVVDVDGYRRALALSPDHARARAALENLTGERMRDSLRRRRLAAAGAMLLLAAFIYMLWRRPGSAADAAEAGVDAGAEAA